MKAIPLKCKNIKLEIFCGEKNEIMDICENKTSNNQKLNKNNLRQKQEIGTNKFIEI